MLKHIIWGLWLLTFCSGLVAQTSQFSINLSVANHHTISQGVVGIGALDRASSSSFARSDSYINAVKDYGSGSLRWPNAGHDNLLNTHWDNNHTYYYSNDNPYTTKSYGNIWDPFYPESDAAPHEEVIDLPAFLNLLKTTKTEPIIMMTWRSGELWRKDSQGDIVWYRDPAPLDMEGNALSQSEVSQMTPRAMQFLENRRFLDTYFKNGGPENPVIQVGGEVFIGWDDGQKPWELSGENSGEWISNTLRAYIGDAQKFAADNSHEVQWMTQFKEANKGGKDFTPNSFLRGEFEKSLHASGNLISFMGCSMHYRRPWSEWLNEKDMTFAFIVDNGFGSAKEIRTWFRTYTASLGYPGIDLIPHANGVDYQGTADGTMLESQYTLFQKGLVNTQFVMELIEADYEYACFYAGIKGDYTGNVGVGNNGSIARMGSNGYQYNPVLYATGLLGEGAKEHAGVHSRRIDYTSNGQTNDRVQLLVIEPASLQQNLSRNGGSYPTNITQALYAYVLNKDVTSQAVSLQFSEQINLGSDIRRYSEGAEEEAPSISALNQVAVIGNEIQYTAPPLSFTRIEVLVENGPSFTNNAPEFSSSKYTTQYVASNSTILVDITSKVTDIDNDTLVFSKINGHNQLSISENGIITINTVGLTLDKTYFLEVEISDGIEQDLAVFAFTVSDCNSNTCLESLGTSQKIKKDTTTVYPVPSEDKIYIQSEFIPNRIEIHAVSGAYISGEEWKSNPISIKQLASGVYILSVFYETRTDKVRFVKE